jgi:DNA-directed RNA polymerase subunit RPC12/RpoP
MNLTCKSCHHDFSVDELNLDTERVDCPKCRWPMLLVKETMSTGYFGRFSRFKNIARPLRRAWPRSGL